MHELTRKGAEKAAKLFIENLDKVGDNNWTCRVDEDDEVDVWHRLDVDASKRKTVQLFNFYSMEFDEVIAGEAYTDDELAWWTDYIFENCQPNLDPYYP